MSAESADPVARCIFLGGDPQTPASSGARGARRAMYVRWFLIPPWEAKFVKKILALAAVAGAVLFIVRRSRSAKAEADLWREATTPNDK